MSGYFDLATLPWADLLPMPWALIAAVGSVAAGYWYGHRHPEGS